MQTATQKHIAGTHNLLPSLTFCLFDFVCIFDFIIYLFYRAEKKYLRAQTVNWGADRQLVVMNQNQEQLWAGFCSSYSGSREKKTL